MRERRPAWPSVALGVVIGLVLAAVIVGGIAGVVLVTHEGPAGSTTGAGSTTAAGATTAAGGTTATPAPSAQPPTTPAPSAQPPTAAAPSAQPPATTAASAAPTAGAPSAAPTAAASPGTASPAIASSDPASAAPSAPAPSAGSSVAPSGPRAVVDPSLLAILPPAVGGVAVHEFPEAEQQAVTDADLGRNVSRVATAFAGDAAGANWAYTAIVDVRPEAQSTAFYRDWQESFDASACERAGGVTGHTTITIAGRQVERTACGQGVRTYHVRISGTGLLVSISDLGDAKLGELEIAALVP